MKAHFTEHPLYWSEDNELCGRLTDELMAQGETVFQLFQKPFNEADHSAWLLSVADPEQKAERVLSLGCGIGGMERYWRALRPELRFELVNISKAQLARCICKGNRVAANAETYRSAQAPFDLVVLCYMLGHVNVQQTLVSALSNCAPWGKILVYDLFEGTRNLRETLFYETPTFKQLENFGTAFDLRFRHVIQDRAQIPMAKFWKDSFGWIGLESRPGLFVFQRE